MLQHNDQHLLIRNCLYTSLHTFLLHITNKCKNHRRYSHPIHILCIHSCLKHNRSYDSICINLNLLTSNDQHFLRICFHHHLDDILPYTISILQNQGRIKSSYLLKNIHLFNSHLPNQANIQNHNSNNGHHRMMNNGMDKSRRILMI